MEVKALSMNIPYWRKKACVLSSCAFSQQHFRFSGGFLIKRDWKFLLFKDMHDWSLRLCSNTEQISMINDYEKMSGIVMHVWAASILGLLYGFECWKWNRLWLV